jgi:hypothetical protein
MNVVQKSISLEVEATDEQIDADLSFVRESGTYSLQNTMTPPGAYSLSSPDL